jgi:hypothetical protein
MAGSECEIEYVDDTPGTAEMSQVRLLYDFLAFTDVPVEDMDGFLRRA